MKKIFAIILCSVALSFSAMAERYTKVAPAPASQTEVSAKDTSIVQDTSKVSSAASDYTYTPNKKQENSSSDFETLRAVCILSLIAIFMAIVSIIVGILAIRKVRRSEDIMDQRLRNRKQEINDVSQGLVKLKNELKSEINSNVSQVQNSLLREINAIKSLNTLSQRPKPMGAPIGSAGFESATPVEKPKFESKTFYGVYKPTRKGVRVEEMTPNKEGATTFEIITESADTALYHIVETLSKTQFASLNESYAIEVVEGNPQSYTTISEVEAGKMKLYDDVWRIEQKVKIKLS